MKKMMILGLAFVLSLLFGFALQAQEDPKAKVVTEKIELFNGKNLDNWYVYMKGQKRGDDPLKVFTVQDGLLRISGEALGGITTNEAFRDYQAIIEFKWGGGTCGPRVDRARDSGFLFHSKGKDGGYYDVWMCSFEANIIEGGMGDFIVVTGAEKGKFLLTAEIAPKLSKEKASIWQKGGERKVFQSGRIDWQYRDPDWKDVKGFRGKQDPDKPVGEWNTMRVVCDGEQVDVYVNGQHVNQAVKVTPDEGRLQLQSEYAEMFVRRVTLLPLDK